MTMDDNRATNSPSAIRPAAFTPLEGSSTGGRRRITLASLAVATTLVLCALILWFIFASHALLVVTDPADAKVELEGGPSFRLGDSYLVLAGSYRLAVSAPGYRTETRDIAIAGDGDMQEDVKLAILPGNLEVQTSVAGVSVELDGRFLGKAPGMFSGIDAGEYRLTLRHPRYRTVEQQVRIRGRDETDRVDVPLDPAWGDVILTSVPAGADISVGGTGAGKTPATVQILESGETVRLQLPGYKAWENILTGTPGTSQSHETIALAPADASVKLTSTPSGARVTVNKAYRGQTPLTLDLDPGKTHHIALFQQGYKGAERTLTLGSGEEKSLAITLEPDLGNVRVSLAPENAQLYVDGNRTAVPGGVLALPARPHKLEARLDGYASASKTVTPKPGIEQQVRLVLVSAAEAERSKTPAQVTTVAGQTLKLFPPEAVSFTMGSSRREQGRRANEVQRDVKLERPFYLSTTPVTNTQFKQFRNLHSSSHAGGKTLDLPDQPVVNISWLDAALYCNWLSEKEGLTPFYTASGNRITGTNPQSLGYRLPSEAEWEWAARHGNGAMARFPWGEGFPPPPGSGNYADQSAAGVAGRILPGYSDGFPVSAPVTRFAANGKGLYSMGHNVAEWIHDFYGSEPTLGTRALADPLGPEGGEFHVIRGTSWRHGTITELRLSFRDYGKDKRDDVGFRVARYAR